MFKKDNNNNNMFEIIINAEAHQTSNVRNDLILRLNILVCFRIYARDISNLLSAEGATLSENQKSMLKSLLMSAPS